MLKQIIKTWRRIGRSRNRPNRLPHAVRLEVASLEERCTPVDGIVLPLEGAVIVQVAAPAAAAPVLDLAKPLVRTDLFCSGFSVASNQASELAEDEPSEFVATKPKTPPHAEPVVQPVETNDVDATTTRVISADD